MEDDRQEFFEELTTCPRTDFKARFGKTARRLGLNEGLSRQELGLLQEAAFLAALCNISINGLGACGGEIRPEKEPIRRKLEFAFMHARSEFLRCAGWRALAAPRKKSIEAVFLTVCVDEENLAY